MNDCVEAKEKESGEGQRGGSRFGKRCFDVKRNERVRVCGAVQNFPHMN